MFSKRPGRVIDRIRTDLAYPRTPELRYTPEFTALEHRAGAGLGVVRRRGARHERQPLRCVYCCLRRASCC